MIKWRGAWAVALGAACLVGSAYAEESKPYGGKPHEIPGVIEAEHYDEGKPGVAYVDLDVENQGENYRGETQVDIEKRPDASNGHGIGWCRAGEWLIYTVDVKTAGTYTVEFPVASQRKGGIFHLDVAGKDVSGPIEIPDTGGWTKLKMIRADKVTLAAGVQQLKLVMDTDGPSKGIGDIDYLKFTLNP